MVLSDRTIKEELSRGRLVIDPLEPSHIQPASVDVCLDRRLLVFRTYKFPHYIDLRQPLDGFTEAVEIPENGHFSLAPGEFVLGSTYEYIGIPANIMARLEGKSSLGRVGLLIHATAGFVDPGWQGNLTLELSNVTRLPILLFYKMKISQISFHYLTTEAERPYGSEGLGSKYQGQDGPVRTFYHKEFQQPQLLPLHFIDAPKKTRERSEDIRVLQQWLKLCEFQGSIRRFAQALELPLKTVESWFYQGGEPSPANREKVFHLTGLPQFQPKTEGRGSTQPPLTSPRKT
ncbi:MAG: dCTP deaminase [Chloroflexota bacterium]